MKPLSLARRMRRALGLITTIGTVGVLAPTALAGPVVDVGAGWTSISSLSGPFTTPDGGNTITAPGGGASLPAGSHLQTRYCNQYGANTQLIGATVRRVRWHATANDITAFMRIQGPDGVDLDSRYLYNQLLAPEMQKDAIYDDAVTFPAGQCFSGGIYAGSTTSNLGFTTLVTNQIQSVKVEDLQGPAVTNPTSSTQWFTGNVANIEWDQSDNQFLRGNTYAQIVGGGTTDLGDTGNGHVGTFVGVGTLTDGQHQICAHRSAQSSLWATATACTVFKLDRTAPGIPSIGLTPDTGGGWTNQDVTITTAQTSDGTGSGWNRNQLNIGGAGWTDGALSVVRAAEGDTPVSARAVDTAGLVSGQSQTRQVRIDKTPPIAALTVDGQSAAGLVSLSTGATADTLSGLKSFVVHLGTSNGPIVATSAPELVDIGQSAPAKNAGTTRFVLVAQDNAGNTATATSPTVRLDSIAPSATLAPVTTGWVRDFALAAGTDNRLSVALDDNTPEGVGLVEVQMRQGVGAWQNVAAYNQATGPTLAQGQHHLAPDISTAAILDGQAELRVVAHDPTFPSLQTATDPQTVRIDRASPDAGDLSGWTSNPAGLAGKYTLTLPTLADATSGLASVEVFANSNPAGLQSEAGFALAGVTQDPTGTVTVTADLSGMAAGIHATRIRATDRAGNVFITSGPVVVLDTSAPIVSPIAIAANGVVSFTLSDAGGFGACPVLIELNGPGTNAAWRNVFEQAAGTLPAGFSFPLPMSGMVNGDYSVRTTVCDAAGNTSVQTKVFTWTGGPSLAIPASANALPPTPIVHNQITQLSADGQVATRVVGGRILPVIRGSYNRPFVLRGQLQRPDGTALVGAGLELRDSAGRYITGGRTDTVGAFAIPARATIGGIWTVNQVGQTDRISAALLEVKPIVGVTMKMTRGTGGSRKLIVTGRLTPQAGAYNKALQLQWRDPANGRWRPAVNGRVAKNGRFRIVYQFRRPGGYRVTFRVAVPTDNGWPYLATNSRGVTLRVF